MPHRTALSWSSRGVQGSERESSDTFDPGKRNMINHKPTIIMAISYMHKCMHAYAMKKCCHLTESG